MKLIKKGAEADIYLTTWDGKDSILKIREKKDYRNPTLDRKIREQRTLRESGIICDVKSFGVRAPLIYFVDTKMCRIYMQQIKGILVRDLPNTKIVESCERIGEIVGLLHKNEIMHGDLTTSNFISVKNKIFLIDFGLAQKTDKVEDHAIDLRLFKEILNSAHVDIMKDSWTGFLRGYRKIVGRSRENRILSQVLVIEHRGRYANVV